MLASVSSSITSQIANHGVYAVFVLMAIDAVFPALSELVMLYAGVVASGVLTATHHVSLFGAHVSSGAGAYVVMALSGTIGYLVGAIVGWWIGLRGGRPLLEHRGRWLHLSPERLDRAERWFDRWDTWAVLIGRITPIARSFISIPAGVFEMPFAPYAVLTAIGSAVWAFVFAGAGWGLGSSYQRFHHDFRYVDYVVVVLLVLLVAWLAWRWIRSSRLPRGADPAR